VHCFDGVEGATEKWRPAVALHKSHDHPSTSLIFAEQTINFEGRQVIGVGQQLFGHGCANGGVVLRPGMHTVLCGHGKDHGAYCGGFCTHLHEPRPHGHHLNASLHERGALGQPCRDAWAPQDIGGYVRRETEAYRQDPGYGHYNEFLVDGLVWDANLPWSIDAFLTGATSATAHAAFLQKYQLTDLEVPLLTMTRKLDELLVPGVRFGDGGGDPCGVWRGPGWMSKPPWAFG